MKKELIKYILALLIFGSNGVIASFIDLSSYEIVLLRSVIGSIFLLMLFLLCKNRFTFHKHRKDGFYIALSGVAMAADWLLLFEAYQRIGVSLGMMINYCGPVIVMALSPLLLHVKITKHKVFAIILTFLGAILISGNAFTTGINLMGLLCAILSAISYAAMILCNKKAKVVLGMENSVLQLLCTCVTVAIFVGIKQGFSIPLSGHNLIFILCLGVINTGLACYLFFSSVSHLPVQTVSICGYLEPVSAVVFSFLILKEQMTGVQIIGAILILAGAIYGECKHTKFMV